MTATTEEEVVEDFTTVVIHIKPFYYVSASIHSLHIHIKTLSHPNSITCEWEPLICNWYQMADLWPPHYWIKAKRCHWEINSPHESCKKSRNSSTSFCQPYIIITQCRVQTFSFTCHWDTTQLRFIQWRKHQEHIHKAFDHSEVDWGPTITLQVIHHTDIL